MGYREGMITLIAIVSIFLVLLVAVFLLRSNHEMLNCEINICFNEMKAKEIGNR